MTKKQYIIAHVLCGLLSLVFVAAAVFAFPTAFGRLLEGCADFWNSIATVFCGLFGIEHNIPQTVASVSKVFSNNINLPTTAADFQTMWGVYWQKFASAEMLTAYTMTLYSFLYMLLYMAVIIIPLAIFSKAVNKAIRAYFPVKSLPPNVDTKPLKRYRRLENKLKHVAGWFVSMYNFVQDHSYYLKLWLVVWLYNFNVFTIALDSIAYYFYLVTSFDLSSLYTQLYKLVLDLAVPCSVMPGWFWVVTILVLLDMLRKHLAYKFIMHLERKNRGFINGRPIVCMVCGTMGKKKTTAITDMALSQEVMFRDKAFEKILENDLKFPQFPWINFEKDLQKAMANHNVYNLATCRRFVASKHKKWQKRPQKRRLWGYNYPRYGLEHNDKLCVTNIWQVLENYAQLYFIYIVQSSLLLANYSVRTDNIMESEGHFPLWNTNFFKRDSRLQQAYSRHSHILDFDSVRLGKKLLEDNANANSFEFGVVVITEIGKERGNNLELREAKKQAETANQKNDLFNSWLKMVRHSATVDNFPFVKVIVDEQRPESWGADARDLCEIVHIRESGEQLIALPFFALEELVYDIVLENFINAYYDHRFERSDNTLSMYLYKRVATLLHKHYCNVRNSYGFCNLSVDIERGTQDSECDANKYYLMNKKIYSNRFSTDCFADFFALKTLRSPIGLEDLPEYSTTRANFAELEKQNSYFINDLLRGFDNK